jgi:hypothetical protein
VFAAVGDSVGNVSYRPSFPADMRFLCVAMLRFTPKATKRPLVTLAISASWTAHQMAESAAWASGGSFKPARELR